VTQNQVESAQSTQTHEEPPRPLRTVRGLRSLPRAEGPDVSHASRFKLSDVYARECCHPDCYAPPFHDVASQVPLCEPHLFDVFKATNRFLNSKKAREQEYQLLPLGADQLLGPCVECGHAGFLTEHADQEVFCHNPDCGYNAQVQDFYKARRDLLLARAGRLSVVYYCRFRDRIKIGTSTNLQNRFPNLTSEEIVGFEFGGVTLERSRHRKFQTWRMHHEWFELSPPVRAHINEVTSLAA